MLRDRVRRWLGLDQLAESKTVDAELAAMRAEIAGLKQRLAALDDAPKYRPPVPHEIYDWETVQRMMLKELQENPLPKITGN